MSNTQAGTLNRKKLVRGVEKHNSVEDELGNRLNQIQGVMADENISQSEGSQISETESEDTHLTNSKYMQNRMLIHPGINHDYVQYINSNVVTKCAEILSEFSFDEYTNPYEFIKTKIPNLKESLSEYDRDMTLKLFYECIDHNKFLIELQKEFQKNTKSEKRFEFWDFNGTHHFEILATIVFFKAKVIEPKNLFKIFSEIPWQGSNSFYRFLLKRRFEGGQNPIMQAMLKVFSPEHISEKLMENINITRHVLRKLLYTSRRPKPNQHPVLNRAFTLARQAHLQAKGKVEEARKNDEKATTDKTFKARPPQHLRKRIPVPPPSLCGSDAGKDPDISEEVTQDLVVAKQKKKKSKCKKSKTKRSKKKAKEESDKTDYKNYVNDYKNY